MSARHGGIQWDDKQVLEILWRWHVKDESAGHIAAAMRATRGQVSGLMHRMDLAVRDFDLDRVPDRTMLVVLDGFHGVGRSASELAHRLGWSRNQVLWMLHQVRLDLARSNHPIAEAATKPGNRNGDMSLGWWVEGLARRAAA